VSEFDRYLERLRERAGLHLSLDAERELRAHFEEAVAVQRRAGRSLLEAELVALDELGKPEVIAAAFRAERRALRRFAGGPGVLVADLARQARLYLAVVAFTAALGALAGRAAPPTYTIRVPLTVLIQMDFGNELGARTALAQLHFDTPVAVHVRWMPTPALEVSNADRTTAVAAAQQAAGEATRQFPAAFQRTLYGKGRASATAIGETPKVETSYPILPGAAAGAGLGVAGIAIRTLLRKRGRR
jgi:hypothetical protein